MAGVGSFRQLACVIAVALPVLLTPQGLAAPNETALMGAAHKGPNDVIELLVQHRANLETHDIGSRDSIHTLAGVSWQARTAWCAWVCSRRSRTGLPVPAEGPHARLDLRDRSV
jgi:hypothetical protein